MARLHLPALALPAHAISAADTKAALVQLFGGEDPRALERIIDHSQVERRQLALSIEETLRPRGIEASNNAYREVALPLAEQSARGALAEAGLAASDIDLVISTSCTGILIPSLDAYLANRMRMRADLRRLPITEAGCAGGAMAVARAHEFLAAYPEGRVLIVAAELPSLTLQHHDCSRANLISSAIFGDGAAAVVLSNEDGPGRPRILATGTHFFHDALDWMGFQLSDTGFRIVLSPEIPSRVDAALRALVQAFLTRHGVAIEDLSFYVLHPGGRRIVDNFREVFALGEEDVAAARGVLADHGNLSSASVFFVLHRLLTTRPPSPGALGLMLAFGPGFTAEMALLEMR